MSVLYEILTKHFPHTLNLFLSKFLKQKLDDLDLWRVFTSTKSDGIPNLQLPLWFSYGFSSWFSYIETVGFFKSPPRLMVHHGAPWAMGLEVMFRKTGSGCVYQGKWSMGIWSNWKCHLPPRWFSDNCWRLKHFYFHPDPWGFDPIWRAFFPTHPPQAGQKWRSSSLQPTSCWLIEL